MITIFMYIFLALGLIFLGITILFFVKNDIKEVFFDVKSQKNVTPIKKDEKETVRVADLVHEEMPRRKLINEIKEESENEFIEEEDFKTENLENEEFDHTEFMDEEHTEFIDEDHTELLQEDHTELLESEEIIREETELLENDKTELL